MRAPSQEVARPKSQNELGTHVPGTKSARAAKRRGNGLGRKKENENLTIKKAQTFISFRHLFEDRARRRSRGGFQFMQIDTWKHKQSALEKQRKLFNFTHFNCPVSTSR